MTAAVRMLLRLASPGLDVKPETDGGSVVPRPAAPLTTSESGAY
jgi:hypothetical protein